MVGGRLFTEIENALQRGEQCSKTILHREKDFSILHYF